jgi:hypothetical protein
VRSSLPAIASAYALSAAIPEGRLFVGPALDVTKGIERQLAAVNAPKELRSPAERARLANALVAALGDARGANLGAFRLKTRRRHEAIRKSADDLLALVLRLRDDQPISVRGAAMSARLLSDGASPLHRDSAHDLQHAIRTARFALDADGAEIRDLPAAA